MQLMPGTARDVARWRGETDWNGDLTDPPTNIAFGTYYLRRVLDRFDGHAVLATASYNAGPHRVASWLPDGAAMEADRWIDTIPYTETPSLRARRARLRRDLPAAIDRRGLRPRRAAASGAAVGVRRVDLSGRQGLRTHDRFRTGLRRRTHLP